MKAIQITIDERLLAALNKDQEVLRDGRSAVLRRAVTAYLQRKRRDRIAEAYERGYGKGGARELEGWAREGAWPED